MKLLISLFLVSLFVTLIQGCEYHDRLRAQAKQRAESRRRLAATSARSTEDNLRQLGRHQYMQDLRRGQQEAIENVRASVHEHHHQPRAHQMGMLPAGSKMCRGTDEYYCPIEATCVANADGSYTCRTETSYRVDGGVSRYVRPDTSRVTNRRYYPTRQGGSYTSTRRTYPYRTGYRRPQPSYRYSRKCGSGETRVNTSSTSWRCEDINECETSEPCEQECRNTQGSYFCFCRMGFRRNGTHNCVDRDECEEIPTICPSGPCVNTEGSFECHCPEGYIKQPNKFCKEIDECKTSEPCAENKICFNLWGSYECSDPEPCPEGYIRPSSSSIDGACILENGTAENGLPHAISFRKVAIEARKEVNSYVKLGSMTFRSGYSDQYAHNYQVDVLEGGDKIRQARKRSPYGYSSDDQSLTIEFYNRVPLKKNVRIPFVMMITDTPTRKSSGRYRYGYDRYGRYNTYGYNDRYADPLPNKRKVEITFVPMTHGDKE